MPLEARDAAQQSLQTATEHVGTLEAKKTRTVEVPFAAAKSTLQDLSSAIGTLADKVAATRTGADPRVGDAG